MRSNFQNIVILENADTRQLTQLLADQYPRATLHHTSKPRQANSLVSRHQPELAVIDLDVINGETPGFIRQLKSDSPQTMCVVASYIEEDTEIFYALKAGAKGYLLKDRETDQILKHLENILAGQPTIAPQITYHMLGYFHKQPNFSNEEKLSDRENEILALIARGLKRTEVAAQLNISLNTVATHLKAVYSKLNINSRAEATLEAVRRGLIKKK
jgi:DNA-binding NarL/FixJ family response regulator